MSEMELELSRFFKAAVGDPPKRVTVQAVRRKAIRRRVVAGASATAAASLAVSAGLAVSASALGTHPAISHSHHTSQSRYYFEAGYPETIFGRIRAVTTGEIKRRIACPRARPYINATAAASGRTFFISCSTTSGTNIQIYRVGIGKSGQFGDLQPVPGGRIGGVRRLDRFLNMAVTASGSELAIATAQAFQQGLTNIVVINTKTGAHARWRAGSLSQGVGFDALDLSFARGGRELAVFGYGYCAAPPNCSGVPGGVLIALSHPARGGSIASGRIIFRERRFITFAASFVEDAFISPDGNTAIASVLNRIKGATVYRISAATGKPVRVLLHLPIEVRFIVEDSFGRILFTGIKGDLRKPTVVNGWIHDGKLIPLPTAGQVRTETW